MRDQKVPKWCEKDEQFEELKRSERSSRFKEKGVEGRIDRGKKGTDY